MIGRTLGSYTIVERIGAGGMGEVYLAKHRRIERKVAVKLLLPALSSDPDIVNRFFNEARATSLITHPGIVQIFDCDVFENRAYIVMEYLEGANLNTVITPQRPVRHPDGRLDHRQIAGALAAAHAKSIVHRDLKPENVFLAEDPLRPGTRVVKILDFGIAKLTDRTGRPRTRAPAASWERPSTWRPSSAAASPASTTGPTCTRWAASSSSCSRGVRPS